MGTRYPAPTFRVVSGQFVSVLLEYEAPEEKIVISQAALKAERAGLENAGAEKEKYVGRLQQLDDRRDKFRSLLSALSTLSTQQDLLRKKQAVYLRAAAEASRLEQIYTTANKAFLDEQAGILASGLRRGNRSAWHECDERLL